MGLIRVSVFRTTEVAESLNPRTPEAVKHKLSLTKKGFEWTSYLAPNRVRDENNMGESDQDHQLTAI